MNHFPTRSQLALEENLVMIGAVARAGSSLLAGKPIEKVGSEVLKVVSSYNVSSKYEVL